jgi:hypothetical protein
MHDAQMADLIERLADADTTLADAMAENDDLASHLEGWLLPAVDLRRTEHDALRKRLELAVQVEREQAARDARLAQLEAELAAARDEAVALRRSISWRLTAPLRRVYGWLRPGGRH